MPIRSWKKFTVFNFLILTFLVSSCANLHTMPRNESTIVRKQLYSYPQESDLEIERQRILKEINLYKKANKIPYLHLPSFKETTKKEKVSQVHILNPGSGILPEPIVLKKQNTNFNETITLKRGGLAVTKYYMQVISEKNPHTLVFDAGGGWQKNKNIYPTIFYRNYIGYHASSLSSHDIVRISENKLTLKAVKEKLKETLLLSNLEFLKVPHRFLSLPIKKYKIFPVGDVKVGVMGITSPKQVVQNFHPSFKGVLFKDPVSTIVETAAHLRKVGADIIVVLYNFGVDCTSQQATEFDLPNHRVNFNYTEAYCDEYKNELTSTLKQLPQLTVDLVITQGMDSKVSNIIYGTAVMQNPIAKGYLGFSEVRYDHHKDRVSDESLIYPPVITCHNFLKNAKDCQLEKNSTLQTVEASFLGVPIPSEAELKSKVFPWEKQKLDL